MLKPIRASIVILLLMTLLTGLAYPLAMVGAAGAIFPDQAAGSLVVRDGKVVGANLIGQRFAEDRYFHGRPSATGDKPYDTPVLEDRALSGRQLVRLEPRPDLQGADRAGQGRCRETGQGRAGRPRNHLGQWPRSAYLAGGRRLAGATGRQGARHERGRAAAPCRAVHPRPRTGRAGRAAGQRPAAQSGPRRAGQAVTMIGHACPG